MIRSPQFHYRTQPVIGPRSGCPWASKMVLNPGIIRDPSSNRLHMLFRASGPWPEKRLPGKPDPYPIFLGYAWSEDGGETWEADFSKPALAPALAYEATAIRTRNHRGEMVPDFANGCVEDPRLFRMEEQIYLTVACRMFPPGPYWENHRHDTYIPAWATTPANPFGEAATANHTTTVLYRVSLERLAAGHYESAFQYMGALTDGSVSDNRDVYLFPHKMRIEGRQQYLMLHRPHDGGKFLTEAAGLPPSIFLAAAETMEDFVSERATHRLLAHPVFDWEEEKIGGSWPPLSLDRGEWLVSYHGKKNATEGYFQSFMIVREVEDGFPELAHRCPVPLMWAERSWELPRDYPTPCLFTTGGVVVGKDLLMSYGAADQVAGVCKVDLDELVRYIRQFGADGAEIA